MAEANWATIKIGTLLCFTDTDDTDDGTLLCFTDTDDGTLLCFIDGVSTPHTYFLKKTPIEEYEKECNHSGIFIIGKEPAFGLVPMLPTWLGIVLPLRVDSDNVYLLPFLIDTSSTGYFYLGKRCVQVLRSEGVLSEDSTHPKHEFVLNGSIKYEGHTLERVVAYPLPLCYEPRQPDLRSNVMGLAAMWAFNIWNIQQLPFFL